MFIHIGIMNSIESNAAVRFFMFERIYATGYPARRHTAVVTNAIQMEFHSAGR